MIKTLGHLWDFIGGIGVIITLIYLASQIRQNTKSIRVSALQAAQRDTAQFMDHLAADPEFVRIFFDGAKIYVNQPGATAWWIDALDNYIRLTFRVSLGHL